MVSCLTVVKVSEASIPFEILYSDNHISMHKAPRVPVQYGVLHVYHYEKAFHVSILRQRNPNNFPFFSMWRTQTKKNSLHLFESESTCSCSGVPNFFFFKFSNQIFAVDFRCGFVVLCTALPCAFLDTMALIFFPFPFLSLSFAPAARFSKRFCKEPQFNPFFFVRLFVSGEPFGFEQLSQLNLNMHRSHWTR